MKNILTILSELGIEVPEDKKETINKNVLDNYKTVAEYEKVTEKRDKYKESLDDVQGKLEAFKDVNVDDLQTQITTLTGELQTEKEARTADAKNNELQRTVDGFLSDKTFVNEYTKDRFRADLLTELDKDSAKGKSIKDIFEGMTTDAEGKQKENILIGAATQKAQENKARFTTAKTSGDGGTITKADFLAMSLDERIKLKESDPELYQSLRK